MTVVKWSNYSWECINAWIWDDCCVFSDVDVIKLTLTETVALVQNRTRIGRILKAGKAIPECIAQAPEKWGQNERNVDYANIYSFMRFHTQTVVQRKMRFSIFILHVCFLSSAVLNSFSHVSFDYVNVFSRGAKYHRHQWGDTYSN